MNDNFIVMIDFLDFRRRAFTVNGIEDSYTIHAGKVDEGIKKLLGNCGFVVIEK